MLTPAPEERGTPARDRAGKTPHGLLARGQVQEGFAWGPGQMRSPAARPHPAPLLLAPHFFTLNCLFAFSSPYLGCAFHQPVLPPPRLRLSAPCSLLTSAQPFISPRRPSAPGGESLSLSMSYPPSKEQASPSITSHLLTPTQNLPQETRWPALKMPQTGILQPDLFKG